MDITPVIPRERQLIQSYGDGGFKISGAAWQGSVLVFPSVTQAWPIAGLAELTAESLRPVTDATNPKVELLLIGTGPTMLPLPAELRRAFRALGIMLDGMDTGAACRTYNVLLSEERRVAAALIAV